jgi:hypothetical protein
MSLPPLPVQRSILDVQNLIGREFAPDDRFRLFQEKVYPALLAARSRGRFLTLDIYQPRALGVDS